jgi:pimeloyl-ACP methyl ester carboxylesterase/DNA-binding CsgD family transcriptional regulator
VEEQAIRFTAAGGRRIAWASSGSGPPLVFSGWWMANLELNWREPLFRAFVEAQGRHRTVIRYDPPGTGLSVDGAARVADLDVEAAALGAVVEAASGGPVDLFAGSSGAPVGIAYAVDHPDRVGRLVLYGGYASGAEIADARSRRAIVGLVREHWGLGSRALANVFMPGASAPERERFVEFQRQAASADEAAASLEAIYGFDVSARLGEVRPGAIVLHRREDRAIPFELGKKLAAGLPEATFVPLDGDDHFPWFGDSDQFLAVTFDVLGIEERPSPAPRTTPTADGDLTARETEILALVATGLSDREIAERLVLSPHTVHRHVANVRTKLGLPTRAAAVAAATQRGLL